MAPPALLHRLDKGRREREDVRFAPRAITTAVNRGTCRKLWQMLEKAVKTPVEICIVMKKFTCLNNSSGISVLHVS